jgi:hypothetical protein
MAEITADPLKDPQTIVKAMRQDVDIGISPRDEFPIHPNFLCLLYHDDALLIQV